MGLPMLEDPSKNGNQVLLFARAFGFWNQTKNPKKCFGPKWLSENSQFFQNVVTKQLKGADDHVGDDFMIPQYPFLKKNTSSTTSLSCILV